MSIVLDASLAIAWLMPDQGTSALDLLFDQLMDRGAVVPAHWKLEVANTLLMAERRGRIDADFRIAALADLQALPIAIDGETAARAWDATVNLYVRRRLTTYDAAYLELAKRTGAALATLDHDLAAAARAEGVTVLGDAA